jgi:uncharacterized protein YyaL (SSP411 family)
VTTPSGAPAGGPKLIGSALLILIAIALLGDRIHSSAAPSSRAPARSPMTETVHAGHKPNRLIHEKSPYLLQHAYNPVDWYPWGEEAFAKARREGKPIFLSIGYSTCHWCHVMERESFENDSVATLLNRDFVSIKVDREERPDVDRIYMTSMQAMGLGGGWPLNAFLTPDLKPFYGGTYFPPHSMPGRPGMVDLLPRVHAAWLSQRAEIERTGNQIFEALASSTVASGGESSRDALLEGCADSLAASFDAERGGFGTAPKFPSIANLDFLMRWWFADPAAHGHARDMALRQLDAMRAGGIHDQLGGGFHRYSTDRDWMVPHFEKMLYDQAQIANAFVEAWLVTRRPEYEATARDVFTYVDRDLGAPEGGFTSAEDADSEGEEGRFYVWTPSEIEGVLGKERAVLIEYHYGVDAGGNFEHGASILHLAHPIEETARHYGLTPDDCAARIGESRAALLEARAKRVRPHRDDKVLAAWNGLMISAMARGARAFGDGALAERATRAGTFAWTHLRDPKTGALHRRWREGEAAGAGQLDDYADLSLGFIDLYQCTFDPVWLERANQLASQMIDRFHDETDGGFFDSPAGDPSIAIRLKDEFDGAELAGNSVAAEVLQRLATLEDRADWREIARRAFDAAARRMRGHPAAMPRMLAAMLLERSIPRHVVIAGDPASAEARAMIREFGRRFLPNDVLIVTTPGARADALRKLAPFASALPEKQGRATAYLCVNYACQLPVTDPAAFAAQLDAPTAAAERTHR